MRLNYGIQKLRTKSDVFKLRKILIAQTKNPDQIPTIGLARSTIRMFRKLRAYKKKLTVKITVSIFTTKNQWLVKSPSAAMTLKITAN